MHNLVGSTTNYVNSIAVPDDGVDPETAASLYAGLQQLADNVATERADRIADVAAEAGTRAAADAILAAAISVLQGNMRLKFQVFTASGTWVCPAGVTFVLIWAMGGGGGGGSGVGGSTATTISGPGGGGGAGAQLRFTFALVTPGNTYNIGVAAGGPGGAAVAAGTIVGNPGSHGGSSTFNADDGTKTFYGGGGGGAATTFDGNICLTYPGRCRQVNQPHFSIYGLGGTTEAFLAKLPWTQACGEGGYGASNHPVAAAFEMTDGAGSETTTGTTAGGGSRGVAGTNSGIQWGGGFGGGAGWGSLGTAAPNGGDGGNGNGAGAGTNGTDGGDGAANTGDGGAGGGSGGFGTTAGGASGRGGNGASGIMVLAWVDNS